MLLTITLSVPPTKTSVNIATNSVYELAFNFININYNKDDVIPKKEIINTIMGVVNNGANYQDINYKIQNYPCNDKDYERFFKTINSSSSPNLIAANRFYYHNELRVFPEPPTRELNIDTGEIEKTEFEYFLEMKASYTMNDLVKYIYSKDSFSLLKNNENRLKGGLKSLLCKYDIEVILFTIDTVDVLYIPNQKKIKNIFEIEDYIQEGKVNLNMKVTESVYNNTNCIVPKKRVLFG